MDQNENSVEQEAKPSSGGNLRVKYLSFKLKQLKKEIEKLEKVLREIDNEKSASNIDTETYNYLEDEKKYYQEQIEEKQKIVNKITKIIAKILNKDESSNLKENSLDSNQSDRFSASTGENVSDNIGQIAKKRAQTLIWIYIIIILLCFFCFLVIFFTIQQAIANLNPISRFFVEKTLGCNPSEIECITTKTKEKGIDNFTQNL